METKIRYEDNFERNLINLGYNVSYVDSNLNDVLKEKANEIVISKIEIEEFYFPSIYIKPKKGIITAEWIISKYMNAVLNKETCLKNYNKFKEIFYALDKKIQAIPTTYGIGIFFPQTEKIEKIKNFLNKLNIEYKTEYSEAKYVYRFIISKNDKNKNILEKL